MMEQEQNGANQDVKRWTAKRKATLILDLIKGTTTVAQAARTYGLTPAEIEEWLEGSLGRSLCRTPLSILLYLYGFT